MTAEKSVLVPLDPDATFALLTEPERLRRWQAVTARVELRAGGEYRWTIVPGHTASGTITEVEPGKRLVFTFGWEGSEDLPPGASTVTITLEPVEGGTEVRLVHSGLTPEQAAGHLEGWTHYAEQACRRGRGRRRRPRRVGHLRSHRPPHGGRGLTRCLPARAPRARARRRRARQTPCAKFTVDDLVEHLVGSISLPRRSRGCAGPEVEPGQRRSPRGRRRPGDARGMAQAGPGRHRPPRPVRDAGPLSRRHRPASSSSCTPGTSPGLRASDRGRRRVERLMSSSRPGRDRPADARRGPFRPRMSPGPTPITSPVWPPSPGATSEVRGPLGGRLFRQLSSRVQPAATPFSAFGARLPKFDPR